MAAATLALLALAIWQPLLAQAFGFAPLSLRLCLLALACAFAGGIGSVLGGRLVDVFVNKCI